MLFGLDLNILVRDESGLTASMPGYLYDANPLNDLQYLLNKDMLYYSVYAPLARGWGEGQTLDEGFTWDEGIWWNHMTAMENYHRPEIAAETLPPDAFRENVAANLAVVRGWIEAHPEVDFRFFLPPYSILFWDRYGRLGEEDAYFDAIAQVCETLLPYENVRLYGFLMDGEIVEDLDNYCDYIHHSGDVSDTLLRKIAAGEDELTAETWEAAVSAWRQSGTSRPSISPKISPTRSKLSSISASLRTASSRRYLYLLMPAADSKIDRRSSGLVDRISSILPWPITL